MSQAPASMILGVGGPTLSVTEKPFFRDADPWAFILFARNVETPDQLRRLCADLRNTVGRDALIFIDQEGGRVRRLRPPHWRDYPAAAVYSRINDPDTRRRAVFLHHRLMADDLHALGITADCAPVLDLPQPDADPIISDRAFGQNVSDIVDLAHAAMAGLMMGGVAPVVKHIPGHGRAKVDSHKALPRIETNRQALEETDFWPFRLLADAPMAMTAHAVFSHAARTPLTVSRKSIVEIVRGAIGFDGLLMSDDLDMKALKGGLKAKTEAALEAGCDIALQCSGKLADMVKVAKGARKLDGRALERARMAELCAEHVTPFDRTSDEAEFDHILARLL